MENGTVIESLKIYLIGNESKSIDNPKWVDVEEALANMGKSSNGGYISLRDFDDSMSMIIFGESGMFQIGIVTEDDEDFVYCNGSKPVDLSEVTIAGNYFKEHQICRDYDMLIKIVKYFYETGNRLENVIWES